MTDGNISGTYDRKEYEQGQRACRYGVSVGNGRTDSWLAGFSDEFHKEQQESEQGSGNRDN